MPRADLIVNLVRAGTQGDQGLFRSTVEAIAAEERAKHHNLLERSRYRGEKLPIGVIQ